MPKQTEVEFFDNRVEAEFDELPVDIQARLFRVIELIEEFGVWNIGMPHVAHLDGKIWEMRAQGKAGWGRALYCTMHGTVLILVCFMKKTNKTPRRIIQLAEQRMLG